MTNFLLFVIALTLLSIWYDMPITPHGATAKARGRFCAIVFVALLVGSWLIGK